MKEDKGKVSGMACFHLLRVGYDTEVVILI